MINEGTNMDIRQNCVDCVIYKLEKSNPGSCCVWFVDNVVTGDKTDTNECTDKMNL